MVTVSPENMADDAKPEGPVFMMAELNRSDNAVEVRAPCQETKNETELTTIH